VSASCELVQKTVNYVQSALSGKRIVLGLSGGVACYKSAMLCRLLVQSGASVRVVMTDAAQQFITVATMQALSGNKVTTTQWDAAEPNHMPHINLTRDADAVLVAPASADFIAKLATGRCDEILSLLCIARPLDAVPLLVAPAMNREMWAHPATQRNVKQIQADGARVLGVGSGDQACGETGDGRMLEPEQIFEALTAYFSAKLLAGQQVLITAGPTFEAIDPVRGITNLSSGKMGFAIARAAQRAGAQVTLVAGPVSLPTPAGVRRVDVMSARDMHAAVMREVPGATLFVATAAVADWRPAVEASQKIKKDGSHQTPALAFTENPDILADVAKTERAKSGALYCVGFAAESEKLLEHARAKRLRKGVPLLVGNLGPSTFGRDDNALLLVSAEGEEELSRASKDDLAVQLIAKIARRMGQEKSL
jgi:phosphopantothenoylcysteine decarboxylase / phosphopantothenate---cysteine ligase